MSNLTSIDLKIQNLQGELLADSRLIAECLNIQHESLMKNINLYLTSIEELGQSRFAVGTVTNSVGARNTVKFAMLNEDQATFLMTLSNNTRAVVKAKLSLVKQFSAAKKLLKPDPTDLDCVTKQYELLQNDYSKVVAKYQKFLADQCATEEQLEFNHSIGFTSKALQDVVTAYRGRKR